MLLERGVRDTQKLREKSKKTDFDQNFSIID